MPVLCVCVKLLSRVRLSATPWTVARQAPLSRGFSRQEYWSGLPFPSPGDLPDPGIEPGSPALQADALPSEPQRSLMPVEGLKYRKNHQNVTDTSWANVIGKMAPEGTQGRVATSLQFKKKKCLWSAVWRDLLVWTPHHRNVTASTPSRKFDEF